jgi:hypothetical protein
MIGREGNHLPQAVTLAPPAHPATERPLRLGHAGNTVVGERSDVPVPAPRSPFAGPMVTPNLMHEAAGGVCILERPKGASGCGGGPDAGGEGDASDCG